MKYAFHVGDKVMIRPDYWEKLSSSKHASPEYLERGGDFIYTIATVNGDDDDQGVSLAEGEGGWPHAQMYLMHVPEPFDEADIEIGGDIL